MLIDTTHIDRLRVNFVAHFNTDNDVIAASNEINAMIDSYPREMTSELRQWLGDQQTSRLTAPLATVDTSKSIDDFQDYLNTIEENLRQFEQNQSNEGKFQVSLARLTVDSSFVHPSVQKLLQQIEDQPALPSNLTHGDRQRVEHLQARLVHAQKQIDQLKEKFSSNPEIDHVIDHVDRLITRLRDVEEQVRANAIQPMSDYERLIPDCQVGLHFSANKRTFN